MEHLLKIILELLLKLINSLGLTVVLFVLFLSCLIRVIFYAEHRDILIPLTAGIGLGLVLNVIFVITRWVKSLFPSYNTTSWPVIDSIGGSFDEFDLDGALWEFVQPPNYPMFARSAKCKRCGVKTICYEDQKKLKVKVKCPNCKFQKRFNGTVNSLLEYITNQYNRT